MLKKIVGEEETLSIKLRVDFSRLPPCQDSLFPTFSRWTIEWPVTSGLSLPSGGVEPTFWWSKPYDEVSGGRRDGGILEPVWSCEPILPPSLIDLFAAGVICDDDEGEEDEVEIDDEMDNDDDYWSI